MGVAFRTTFFAIVFCAALALVPHPVHAVQGEADAMCNPVIPVCGCMQIMGPKGCIGGPNMFQCPCFDVTSGFTTSGICMAPNKCLGQSTGGMMPMLPMIPMMMPKMDMMMPQDPCMQGGTGGTQTSSTSPCSGYGGFDQSGSIFDTSSYFNASSSDFSSSLFDDMNNPTGGGVSNFLVNATATASTTGTQETNAITSTTSTQLTGSIKVGEAGASVIANLRDGAAEVAGFFGGATFGGSGAQSVAGRLCATRPWSASPISKIIPNSFFDTLCTKAGFQVGVSTPPAIPSTDVPVKKATTTRATSSIRAENLGPVEIDIWAEPSSVRLGTRTYIFWRSQGVLDCTVAGPNFTQSALAGGASTVPLSGATTYTLTCSLPNGTTVSDSVTVQLAL